MLYTTERTHKSRDEFQTHLSSLSLRCNQYCYLDIYKSNASSESMLLEGSVCGYNFATKETHYVNSRIILKRLLR